MNQDVICWFCFMDVKPDDSLIFGATEKFLKTVTLYATSNAFNTKRLLFLTDCIFCRKIKYWREWSFVSLKNLSMQRSSEDENTSIFR